MGSFYFCLKVLSYSKLQYLTILNRIMREEGKDLDSLLILTKDNLKTVLDTPYVKNSRVVAFCERCI